MTPIMIGISKGLLNVLMGEMGAFMVSLEMAECREEGKPYEPEKWFDEYIKPTLPCAEDCPEEKLAQCRTDFVEGFIEKFGNGPTQQDEQPS